MKRAIEDSFPIVEINRLTVPERSAFKAIYQMHKWFARRASCVFRAILLGALKPLPTDEKGNPTKSGAQVIMDEFYKDHSEDPDTNGRVILDPFMGGGTTVVEALRLGCKVIGIDLNPVAWFIVKNEVGPVDIDELKAAFERLANRRVEWSGKTVRETLVDQYKAECPCCGNKDADIIYTFWVKSAICHNKLCPARSGDQGAEVPLFSDYIVAYKKPSIRYWPDVSCPKCGKTFDWEIEPAALVAHSKLMQEDPRTSAGEGRGNVRWTYGPGKSVCCPWCEQDVKPLPRSSRITRKGPRPERKKVPLTVLLCPHCESVWQWRGDLPESVSCPACKKAHNPQSGNVTEKAKFVCPTCGTQQAIIESVRRLPEELLLPTRPYAVEGYCSRCGNGDGNEESENSHLFVEPGENREPTSESKLDHLCLLTKRGGKFYKQVSALDLTRYQTACKAWEAVKAELPYPHQEIPLGEKTKSGLLAHHYRYWHQLFTGRQLICLATLLNAIQKEQNQRLREAMLLAFSNTLEANNTFTRNRPSRKSAGGTAAAGIFSRHDYQPKSTFSEQNVWGVMSGSNTFTRRMDILCDGLTFAGRPSDLRRREDEETFDEVISNERIDGRDAAVLHAADSRDVLTSHDGRYDFVVTDPPYSDNVNYAELADFFYVWLRLALARDYASFAPDTAPKAQEIIKNPTRGLSDEDFRVGLQSVFRLSREKLAEDGLLVFTFHHSEGSAWESLLLAICEGGWEVVCIYPVHAESEVSLHLMDKEGAISYDLIHVCKKRDATGTAELRSWAGIRQEIRQRAREEIRAIESGRYGNEPLAPTDVNIVLIGKCLELYSSHYGKIVDHEGNPMPLHAALEEIRMLVDQLTSAEQELPGELEDVDVLSYVYLTSLCSRGEVKSDEVHKATRGILEPDELLEAGLIIRGRANRGRTYEVKQPIERLPILRKKFGAGETRPQAELFSEDLSESIRPGVLFIDYVHFLLGFAETGESVMEWLERFRGRRGEIRVALEYMARKNKNFAGGAQRIIGLMDERTLFTRKEVADA
jgi:adenine-specific DNA methylase